MRGIVVLWGCRGLPCAVVAAAAALHHTPPASAPPVQRPYPIMLKKKKSMFSMPFQDPLAAMVKRIVPSFQSRYGLMPNDSSLEVAMAKPFEVMDTGACTTAPRTLYAAHTRALWLDLGHHAARPETALRV